MSMQKLSTFSAILVLALPLSVLAKDKWEFHEEQWKNVPVHEKRMIADDSLSQWGPWEDIAAPGTGGSPAVGIAPQSIGFSPNSLNEVYRPLSQASAGSATGSASVGKLFECSAGDLCGFGVYVNSTTTTGGKTITSTIAPALANMTVSSASNTVLWTLKQSDVTDNAPTYNNLGALAATVTNPLDFSVNLTSVEASRKGTVTTTDSVTDISTSTVLTAGELSHKVSTYTSGNGATSAVTMTGSYVVGTPTPVADLTALLAGNVSASYNGAAAGGSTVSLAVNFGAGTWTGSWNNGADGKTSVSKVGTETFRTGVVGFSASGTISGQTFSASSLSATDALSVTGSVQGAFFGANAQSLGGVADITKTSAKGSYNYTDVFSATKIVK